MPATRSTNQHHDFKSLREFYPYYLTEHLDQTNRRLHYLGTSLVILVLIYATVTMQFSKIAYGPFVAYPFAWVGHFFFELNKPATFKYPLWSLASDFIMYFSWLRGTLDAEIKLGLKKFGASASMKN